MAEEIKEVPDALIDKVVLDEYKILAEHYSAEELADLSKEEIEGILLNITGDDKEEAESELSEEELKKIAETPEAKVEREKAEKDAADLKALDDEAKTKKVTVEELRVTKAAEAEAAKKAEAPAEGEITEDDLLDFEPVVAESELPAEDNVPPELQTKLDDLDAKFDAGDMEKAQYNKERDKINRDIVMTNVKARDAAKEELVWKKEQAYFFASKPPIKGET